MYAFREITPLGDDDIFVLIDSLNNGFDYPLHHHPEYELTLIQGSSGSRIVGDSVEKYENWDMSLVGPYLIHKWDGDDSISEALASCRVLTVQFHMTSFMENFFSKRTFYKIQALLQLSTRGVVFGRNTFRRVWVLLDQMTKAKGVEGVLLLIQVLNILSLSRSARLLTSEGFSQVPESMHTSRFQTICNYVLENFRDPKMRIDHIAKFVNMTPSAFSHYFRKSANRSYTQFLHEVRLGYASKLLLSSDDQVSKIAYESGFSNLSNFNRAFKKHFKRTPKEFRSLYLAKNLIKNRQDNESGHFVLVNEEGVSATDALHQSRVYSF